MIYTEIKNLIKESKNIAILSHVMPDGDNIGSGLAMCKAVMKFEKKASFILDDNIPEIYQFLPGSENIVKPGNMNDFDLIIALDCGDLERLGESGKYILEKPIINIDHHISNTCFGLINLVDKDAAATGELVYRIISEMGIKMDKDIAECLYVAISTDTGHFQYSNTSSMTHKVISDLLTYDINVQEIYNNIYQSNSKQKTLLIGEALKSIKFELNDKLSIIALTKKQIEQSHAKEDDTEGIIGFGRDIKGIEVALFLKEIDESVIKVGFRSKKYVDVSKIAQKYGGGGHLRAAGCTIKDNLNNVEKMLINDIAKII